MHTPKDRARWVKRLLMGSFGAVIGCTSTTALHPHKIVAPWPAEAPVSERHAVLCPITQQARNGAIVEATLFNYHYRPEYEELRPDGTVFRRPIATPTADLLPAGSNLIQRLARRASPGQELWLFVQVANDVPFDPKNPGAWAQKRQALNQQRLRTVEGLIASVRPDVVARVNIIDTDEVGMPGSEAAKALGQMIDNTQGTLRPDVFDPRQAGGGAMGLPGGGGPIGGGVPPSPTPTPGGPDPGSAPGGLNPG